MSRTFIPKPHCTNQSGGCFNAGGCLYGCDNTVIAVPPRTAEPLRFVIPPAFVKAVHEDRAACGIGPKDEVFVMREINGPLISLADWVKP